jgi:hypothetical protein
MHREYYGVSLSDFVNRLLGQNLENTIASLTNDPDMFTPEHQFSQGITSGMKETAVLRAIVSQSSTSAMRHRH